ncbi:hypothetical protein [Mycobacterium sp.]|nr:hypothetical protein [Mycobacterium sp.]
MRINPVVAVAAPTVVLFGNADDLSDPVIEPLSILFWEFGWVVE